MQWAQTFIGDHPARIDKTDRTEENQESERETRDQDLGNKMISGITAVVLERRDIEMITEKIEDILQLPRPHQHLELITGI